MWNNNDSLLIVLVVEDDCLLRSFVVDHLQEAGCVVVEAETAEQAIALCESELPIDVVFTDIHLRDALNGWDVGEAARSARGDIPVLYTSGSVVGQPRPVPGSRFFNKPYRPADILSACRELCELPKRRARLSSRAA